MPHLALDTLPIEQLLQYRDHILDQITDRLVPLTQFLSAQRQAVLRIEHVEQVRDTVQIMYLMQKDDGYPDHLIVTADYALFTYHPSVIVQHAHIAQVDQHHRWN